MPGALDYLFGQQPPVSVTSNVAQTNGLPDWYQEYIRGIAGKATQIAGSQAAGPIPARAVAGFSPDELQSFQDVRNNYGVWQPYAEQAGQVLSGMGGAADALVQRGQNAVAGGTATWDDTAAKKYMSPYTTQVIDNIQRLGTRNFQENIMPGISDQMIGAGQFGSTRNADILSRAGRDVNADISGQVAGALNSGYTNAQTMFTTDNNRQQAQQQLQSNAAITGANALTSAGQAAASGLGALGTNVAGLALNDAQVLGVVGGQQRALTQAGLDADFTNQTAAQNFDWNNLERVSAMVRGQTLPSTPGTTATQPLPGATFAPGALATVGGALSTGTTRP